MGRDETLRMQVAAEGMEGIAATGLVPLAASYRGNARRSTAARVSSGVSRPLAQQPRLGGTLLHRSEPAARSLPVAAYYLCRASCRARRSLLSSP